MSRNTPPQSLDPTDPPQKSDQRRRDRSGRDNGRRAQSAKPRRTADLIEHIKQSADKLLRDRTSRGDLKILSRALGELRYAFKVFAPYRHCRKVTMFGSARTPSDRPAYNQAVEFARAIAAEQWLVITGAASGIMEAGHVGAGRDNSMGLNILLPFEQAANSVIAGDPKLVHMRYFFTRKLMFMKESHAFALFPGGFGTLDESFELLTLIQTGKSDMHPIVLMEAPNTEYWGGWLSFVEGTLVERGMIRPADLDLFTHTTDIEVAADEICHFYDNYHSQRFVNGDLILRLLHAPGDDLMAEINDEFSDILTDGRFAAITATPEEIADDDVPGLPRIRFRFDRRSFGRLRRLIDLLNDSTPG